MNIRDYEYIITIAKLNSISKAAEQLYITQPALTNFLQRLENDLSARIFFREGNNYVLTPLGEIFVKKGQEILKLDGEVAAAAERARLKKIGSIRLGITAGRLPFICESIVPEFKRLYPNTSVRIELISSLSMNQYLLNDQLDIAVFSPSELVSGVAYHQIGEIHLVLAVSIDHPLLSKASYKPGRPYPVIANSEWVQYPLIQFMLDRDSGRGTKEYLKKYNLEPDTILIAHDFYTITKAVSSNLGVAILYDQIPEKKVDVKYLSLENDSPSRQFVVASRKEIQKNSTLNGLQELLINYFTNQ